MKVASIHLRNFRGLAHASLADCAALNVLIGRNNAGKSSVIAALEIAFRHFSTGRVATIWQTKNRPVDEFTNRETNEPLQIGLSFFLSPEDGESIRSDVIASGTGLEIAVEQLKNAELISVICAGIIDGDNAVLYVQELGIGPIDAKSQRLRIPAKRLLVIPEAVARELANRERAMATTRNDIKTLDQFDRSILDFVYRDGSPNRVRRFREIRSQSNFGGLQTKIDEMLNKNETIEEFNNAVEQLKSSIEFDISELDSSPTSETFQSFAGHTNVFPEYVSKALLKFGETEIISFKEIRNAVGRDEAAQILRLKTKRGGAEALAHVQTTVKSLLGVQVDAFEPELDTISALRGRRSNRNADAEMDVDNFLVEANGAGIREALRIILDLELKKPNIAFIEEPEVHLHPGLEKVLHNYLVKKSETIQLFVATHSTNFIDASSRQNVYLVSKSNCSNSTISKVASEGDLLRLTEEVGLKPSTVLMFDRLVFVEGPSDEDVLTELSTRMGLDLSASSTAFVQMGGASRFAHYAAKATLDLLSRRQLKMWFVIDRDERNDLDVKNLLDVLGDKAQLTFLNRREIENYLLIPEAIHSVILEKLSTSENKATPTVAEIDGLLKSVAESLLERAVALRIAKTTLKPVYASYGGSNPRERLEAMRNAISERITTLEKNEVSIRAELESCWEQGAIKLAPGSEILDGVFGHYGLNYKKEIDGRRLASKINVAKLDAELEYFLREIAAVQTDI
ncbi:AAA family ATPase [Sphingomonas sp. Leaf4]|uniref:AAA family ATPase n=1 Tax=Sphingomonas sp. Leaf4 TaxID=2876553 RepID=UPI001E35A318|nr:AAA family ATPase [Sphingomonas sp. Leaf4]